MTVEEARAIAKDGHIENKDNELAQEELARIYRGIKMVAEEGGYYRVEYFGKNVTYGAIDIVINQLLDDGYKVKTFGILTIHKIEICWKPKKEKKNKTKKEHCWLWYLFH